MSSRVVLSIDVGYRNCAKVLGEVLETGHATRVVVLRAEVCDVLQGRRHMNVADTASQVVDHLLPWVDQATEVVCEAQVRASGVNYGIAHALLGAARARGVPFAFMRAKRKFAVLDDPSDRTPLKKRAVVLSLCKR